MKDKEEGAEYDLSWYVDMLICWYVDAYVWAEYEEGGEYDPIQLVEQVQVWFPTFH